MVEYFEVEGPAPQRQHWTQWAILALNTSMFAVMFLAAAYTVPLMKDANILLGDAQSLVGDMNEIIPEVSETLRIVGSLCEYENFTRTGWSFICD